MTLRRLVFALGCAAALVGGTPAARAAPAPNHAFGALAISPDALHVALLEADVPPAGGEGRPHLILRDTETGTATDVKLPCGDHPQCQPGAPAWSPDGSHVAFTVRQPGSFARTIYTVDAKGDDLTPVAAFDGTVITLRYGRDGRLAALVVANANKEAGATQAGAPLRGQIGGDVREQRIAVVEGDHLRFASPPGLFVYEYDWLPDGSGFIGTAAPGDGDAHWWTAKLFAFEGRDGAARVLYAPRTPQEQLARPRASPDGRSVAFIRGLMSDFAAPGGDAYLLPLSGGEPANLTPGLKATVASLNWICGSNSLLAGLQIGGENGIARVDPNGAPPELLWHGATTLFASDGIVAQACRSGVTAAIAETFTEADEIVAGPIGNWRKITHVNAATESAADAVDVHWRNDGFDMEGWLLLPHNAHSTPMPLITIPHGGPAWAYGPAFYGPSSTRALLEAGYALFQPNPRGSYGQGEAFTQANVRDFGYGDLRDILAGIDEVLRSRPDIDRARLGVTGTSYGGFMTMWSVTQTTRFKAAVARAGISDWQSYYGTNRIGDWLIPYFGATLYDDPAIYNRSTPIGFAKAARTPTLILVGADDIECPPGQSQEFWTALTQLDVPSELYIYPGEGHVLRDPKHAADANARTVAWFDRYLR
ncbi:MAG TPA: prolyl oligopeptidase family serine peptidase [Acetobacteraceae bacterium]|nr:prolyl oligopeptidase family serine peptidase [Acetobacteraceae bacterium]